MLNSTGAVHVHAGRLDEAREVLLEALADAEATLPPIHPSIATVLGNLAQVDIAQGHPEDAMPRYERVLEIYRTIHPEPHADLSSAMHNYASTFDALDQRERAVELYREALQLRIDTMGPTHPATAGTMHNLGLLLALHFDADEADEGVELLEKALELRLAADVDPYLRATTTFMLARAYEKRGDLDAAIAKAEQSRGYLRQIQPRHADILAHVEAWLAKKQTATR
jgi:tetratricopeptide (TPR) repeat protein